jgi:hypothetical protein
MALPFGGAFFLAQQVLKTCRVWHFKNLPNKKNLQKLSSK